MKKERKLLRVADLQLNEGQLGWLPKNPRQWTQEDIDKTAASIREDEDFLEERPILVIPIPGTGDFVVFCGNLRREGAKAAGLVKVPCVVHYPETEDDREAVLRRSLKDNGSFGRFDWDEMANSPVWGQFDLALFGIPSWPQPSEGGEGGQQVVGGVGGGEAHEDDFDEESDEIHVRCKKGDIWQLGEHRLMCGDSTDLDTVKSLMGGALADMVLTDPPYGTTQLYWDNAINLRLMWERIKESIMPTSACLLFGAQPFVTDLINSNRDMYKYEIIWKKTMRTGFFDANKRPLRLHEVISVFYQKQPTFNPQKYEKDDLTEKKGRKRGNSNFMKTNGGFVGKVGKEKAESYYYEETGTRYPTDVVEFSNWNGSLFGKDGGKVVHPCQKPLELIGYLLATYSNHNELVLDIFGGSGTTLIAAEQLGRKCYMMELDPNYCDIILARWEEFTGKTAVKLN